MKINKFISIVLIIIIVFHMSSCTFSNDVALNLMIKDYEKNKGIEELGDIVIYTWTTQDYKKLQKYGSIFFDECLNNNDYYNILVTKSKTYLVDEQQIEDIVGNPELYFNSVLWCYIISYLLSGDEPYVSIKATYEVFKKYYDLFLENEIVNFYNSSLISFSAWNTDDTIKEKVYELLLIYSIENPKYLKQISGFLSGQYIKLNNFETADFFSKLSLLIDKEDTETTVFIYSLNETDDFYLPDFFDNNSFENKIFENIILDYNIKYDGEIDKKKILILRQGKYNIVFLGNPIESSLLLNENTGDFQWK